MNADRWFLLGAPWDCSASGRGEERAPLVLRSSGLSQLVAEDLGDAATAIAAGGRDARTGVLALDDTVAAANRLADALAMALEKHSGKRALVIGGDCSILLGIIPALRRTYGRVGLWFVDGHPDYQDPHGSDTGETADMDLALLTGAGPADLTELAGPLPMVEVTDTILIGHRAEALDDAAQAELDRVPSALHRIDANAVRRDPSAAAASAADVLSDELAGAWLHIDLDVLDPEALPAVTYPQSGGLDWDELAALLGPLASSPFLLGISIADFRPDLDPDGGFARRITALVEGILL